MQYHHLSCHPVSQLPWLWGSMDQKWLRHSSEARDRGWAARSSGQQYLQAGNLFIALSPMAVAASRICPDTLCQSTPAPSQSRIQCPGGNTSCPLPCYQSHNNSPLPPFPLGEITQGAVNSGSIACGTTTLHQRTRIWPFIFPNTGE